jgi:PAS domain S-box-containing protein
MGHTKVTRPLGDGRLFAVPSFCEPRQLLDTLFCTPALGFVVFDRNMRFQAVNSSLAAMNGTPAKAHLGRTISEVVGSGASKEVEPTLERVLRTGKTVLNSDVTAELQTRTEAGHWIVNYFPLTNRRGRVRQVGATVLEITKTRKLEETLRNFSRKLISVDLEVRRNIVRLSRLDHGTGERAELFAQSFELLNDCVSEARAISQFLHLPLPLTAARPLTTSASELRPVGLLRGLSPREREVLQLLAESRTNKQIANILDISTRTVETYRARIMLKLEVRSFGELVRYAVRNNIIQA